MEKHSQEAENEPLSIPTGFVLLRAAARYQSFMEARFGDGKVKWNELKILAFLVTSIPPKYKDEGMSQQQIAGGCDLNKATVVHAIDRLEDLKLVVRRQHKTDRRVNDVVLTAEGRRAGEGFVEAVYRCDQEEAFAGMSHKEISALRSLLDRPLFPNSRADSQR